MKLKNYQKKFITRRKRPFILIEVLLGITILGLSLFSLIGFPLRLFSKHQAEIKKTQIRRILTAAELNLMQEFAKKNPWDTLPKVREKTPVISYPFQDENQSCEIEFFIQCQGEYKKEQHIYKLLLLKLIDRKTKVSIQRKFIVQNEDLS